MALLEKLKTLFPGNTPEQVKENKGYNPQILAQYQPQGGIKFEPNYAMLGNGYVTCLHIYKYQSDVNDFWLEPILNMANVICTIDIISANKNEVVETINRGLNEQSARFDEAKTKIERKDAEATYFELDQLYDEVKVGEVLKYMHIRLFVKAKTIDELEVETKKVLEELESMNFRAAIFLNEQEWEWQSMFNSYTTQSSYMNKRKGKEIPCRTIAGGYPFYYTNLIDPHGTYLGTTYTGGTVVFDLFHKDQYRKHYNALMVGMMGSGKSTLLKKQVLERSIRGDKVRILDVTGEFSPLVRELNGKQVALDGSEGIINPLQVYKTAINEDGSTNHKVSFMQHLSKMKVFYNYVKPTANDDEKSLFISLLRQLYIDKKLWSSNNDEILPIANTPANEFPIFSNLLELVRNELYENIETRTLSSTLSENTINVLSSIELSVKNLCEVYGQIFNGVSSIDSFEDEQIVSFPIRSLMNMQGDVFQAQLFNIMNMLWDGMIVNGAYQFKLFNEGKLDLEDAVRYEIIIDEAHNIINTRDVAKPAVEYIERFMREARKYFGGIFFVSHSINDFVPNYNSMTSNENAENIKKLFQLTQYKFIAQQDTSTLPVIKAIFEGQVTDSELQEIPKLETGHVLLCITGLKNIAFEVDIPSDEMKLFGGGA